MQPIELADDGCVRFRANPIVRHLLEVGPLDLNEIVRMRSSGAFGEHGVEAYDQLMQLIGYSVSGYGDLSTSPPETVEAADELAAQVWTARKNAPQP